MLVYHMSGMVPREAQRKGEPGGSAVRGKIRVTAALSGGLMVVVGPGPWFGCTLGPFASLEARPLPRTQGPPCQAPAWRAGATPETAGQHIGGLGRAANAPALPRTRTRAKRPQNPWGA